MVAWPLACAWSIFNERALRLPWKVGGNTILCDGEHILLGSLLDSANGDLIRDADIVLAAILVPNGS
jgi:hypothetical protein